MVDKIFLEQTKSGCDISGCPTDNVRQKNCRAAWTYQLPARMSGSFLTYCWLGTFSTISCHFCIFMFCLIVKFVDSQNKLSGISIFIIQTILKVNETFFFHSKYIYMNIYCSYKNSIAEKHIKSGQSNWDWGERSVRAELHSGGRSDRAKWYIGRTRSSGE